MRVFAGITSCREAVTSQALSVTGSARLTRALPTWFAWSPFAPAVRTRLASESA
ncbi:MAG: hypothetical protein R2734_15435 [Nocardioides sp.]